MGTGLDIGQGNVYIQGSKAFRQKLPRISFESIQHFRFLYFPVLFKYMEFMKVRRYEGTA